MIPVQLEYASPAGCPTQAEFVAKVVSRGGDFAHPGPSATVRAMRVGLRREGSEHTGSLQLRSDGADSEPRIVHAVSCAEVADALAVVAAIALRGPEESSEPASPSPSPPLAVAASAPAPSPPAAQPVAPAAPVAPKDTRLRPVGMWGTEAVPVTTGQLQVDRSMAATLSGGVVLGAIPGVVLPRYDLNLMRTNFISTPAGTNHLIGNVFGVRWSFLGPATHRSDGYSTELNGITAGVSGCTPITYDMNGFVFLVCANFAVGLMGLETRDSEGSYKQEKNIGLGIAALELNGRYNIGKYFHVSLALGGEMWMSQPSAEQADGSELFKSNMFSANAQLGIGLHF